MNIQFYQFGSFCIAMQLYTFDAIEYLHTRHECKNVIYITILYYNNLHTYIRSFKHEIKKQNT